MTYRPGIGTKDDELKCHVENGKVVHVDNDKSGANTGKAAPLPGSYEVGSGQSGPNAYAVHDHKGGANSARGKGLDGPGAWNHESIGYDKALAMYNAGLNAAGVNTFGQAAPAPLRASVDYDNALRKAGIDTQGRSAPVYQPSKSEVDQVPTSTDNTFTDELVNSTFTGQENIAELRILVDKFGEQPTTASVCMDVDLSVYGLGDFARHNHMQMQEIGNLIADLRRHLNPGNGF